MKKFLKYILVFLIPIIVMIIFFAIKNIYPFGEFSPRIYDSYHQYTGFLIDFKNLSFYNVKAGLGFNYYATACYYLFSPINLILLFANHNNIDILFMIIILIKFGLASTSMYHLLNKTKKSNWALIFSIIYALSGFITAYYYNIMWIDAFYMLPIVIYGLNRLIENDKPFLYLISLSLTIIINFYTGYMICIFSLLYFIFRIVNLEKDKRKKALINFIIYSLLSGLISCVVLLPAFFGLLSGKASGYQRNDWSNYTGTNIENIILFPYKLTPGSFFKGDQINGPMQIFSTLFVFIMFLLTFYNKKYNLKYKISLAILTLFFILSFYINILDYAWQFFQRPVWWNNRYSFIFSFMLIYFAYQNFTNRESININKGLSILLYTMIPFIFSASIIYKYLNTNNISNKIYILAVGIMSLLFIVSYITFYNSKMYRPYIIVLIIIELLINNFTTVGANVSDRKYTANSIYSNMLAESINNINDNSFYRTELISKHLYNEGLIYNYNGINYFNSVRNQKFVNFSEYVAKIKIDSHCSTVINYFDPILLTLFDIKYIIGNNQNYYPVKYVNGNMNVYYNKYAKSIGYLVNNDIKNIEFNKKEHKTKNLNKILNIMTNSKSNYYEPFKYNNDGFTVENGEYNNGKIINYDDKKVVVVKYSFTSKTDGLIVPINTIAFNSYSNVIINDEQFVSNGTYLKIKKNDQITIISTYDEKHFDYSDFNILIMNEELVKKDLDNLTSEYLKLNTNTKHIYEGYIKVTNNHTLFLSIPYEDGFIIKVDGKKVPYYQLMDAFIGIDLNEGNHHITIDYISKGFNIGLSVSIMGIVISLFLFFKKNAIINKE